MSDLKFVFKYFKKHITKLIIAALLVFTLSLLILPTPLITKDIIDAVLPQKDLIQLLVYSLILLFLHLLKNIIGYLQGTLFYKVNATVMFDMRVDLLDKISKLQLEVVNKYGAGYFISRIHEDTQKIGSLMADSLITIIKDIMTIIVGVSALFYINYKVAIISLVLLPLYIILTIFYSKLLRKKSFIYFENSANASKQLEESLNTIELSKVFVRYDYIVSKYANIAKKKLDSNILLGKINYKGVAATGIISGAIPIIILCYGGYEVIHSKLTIGSLIALTAFLGFIIDPLGRLANINGEIQQSLVALRRIKTIMGLSEEDLLYKSNKVDSIEKISLDNVSFSYEQKLILDKINIDILMGEKIGIVGRSGNGKTTLFKILTGLYAINSGEVKVNDVSINIEDLIYMRNFVAVVEQDPVLFNDTISNNIKFGTPNATMEEVIESTKKVLINEFIESLPDKYTTIVERNGTNLSVGQKQKIAIARALLKKPKILLLDEVTANVDNISEEHLSNTVFNLPKDIIVIIIAHRLSTIKKCDKIFVLEDGKLIENGTHEELLNKKGVYTMLYNRKLG